MDDSSLPQLPEAAGVGRNAIVRAICRVMRGVRRSKRCLECSGRVPSWPHLSRPHPHSCRSNTSMPGTRPWITQPAGTMDATFNFKQQNTASRSRGAIRPRLASIAPSETTRGRREAGCALHPRSRVQNGYRKRTRAYRFSGGNPAFLRNGFTAYNALSPVKPSSFATVTSQISPQSLRQRRAPERHVFASA